MQIVVVCRLKTADEVAEQIGNKIVFFNINCETNEKLTAMGGK